MAIVLSDRIKETTLTEGTADLELAGSSTGFDTFKDGVGDGENTYYTIENFGRWEIGIGTYTESTDILSRDTVLSSNNIDDGSAIKINLSGVSTVFVTYPAKKVIFLDEAGYATSTVPGYLGVKFPDGSVQTVASYLTGAGRISPDTGLPLEIERYSAGNIFHGHVSGGKRLGLYITSDVSFPTWILGLQSGTSDTTIPNETYAFGGHSSVGMHATTDTVFRINYSNGFWIKHKDADLINIGRDGTTIYNDSSSEIAVTIKGAAAQAANLQEWQSNTGTTRLSVNKDGVMVFDTKISDTSAPNKSLYYSSTQDKLSFKDDAGVVHTLY